jgi:hypothetical protein
MSVGGGGGTVVYCICQRSMAHVPKPLAILVLIIPFTHLIDLCLHIWYSSAAAHSLGRSFSPRKECIQVGSAAAGVGRGWTVGLSWVPAASSRGLGSLCGGPPGCPGSCSELVEKQQEGSGPYVMLSPGQAGCRGLTCLAAVFWCGVNDTAV